MASVGILGGGISGLSALHFAKKGKVPNATLFEKNSRVGGWIHTAKKPIGGPVQQHMFERGPRSIRGSANGDLTLGLAVSAGVSSDIVPASSFATKRYLYMKGKVSPLPTDAMGIFQAPLRNYLPSILKDIFLTRYPPEGKDESIAEFFGRHLGERATREMVGGVVVGIYGGNIDRLSMRSCFGFFLDGAIKSGSLVRSLMKKATPIDRTKEIEKDLNMTPAQSAEYERVTKRVKGGIFSFPRGVEELPKAIEALHKEDIVYDSKVTSFELLKASQGSLGKVKVTTTATDGSTRSKEFDRIISCLPAHQLGPLLANISPEASAALKEIEYINMGIVSLAFEDSDPKNPIIPEHLRGFGYLVPPYENKQILGVAFDSISFPDQSPLVRMAVLIGGDLTNNKVMVDVANTDHKTLLDIALRAIRDDLGITRPPLSSDVFVAEKAIPQYTVGHNARVKSIEAILKRDFPQLHLGGASYNGVSVNDCVASGRNAAKSALAALL